MNWYAYKVLADTYDADRRAAAAEHRRSRQAARHARVREDLDAVEAVARDAGPGRWRSIVARLRPQRATTSVRPVPTELRPSLPR